MLHLVFTFSALAVMLWLLVRMSSRDHVADPMAMLLWLTLCFFNTDLLGLLSTLFILGVVWSQFAEAKSPAIFAPNPR